MIAKKNPRYNLEGKRIVIFSLGLLTTTAAALAAFTYQSPLESELEKQRIQPIAVDYVIQEEEPIIEKQDDVVHEQQDQQNDDRSSDDTMDPSDLPSDDITAVDNKKKDPIVKVNPPGGTGVIGIKKIDRGEIIPWPTKDAAFIGGYGAMQEFIVRKQNYPQDAIELGIQGTVYVNFVVEKDGSISNITIEKSISPSLDREAKRIVQNFPSWIPGEVDAEPVRTRVLLPIKFVLE